MLKAAVIGAGAMGKNHARVYSEINGVELVGLSDSDPSKKEIAENLNANFYENFAEMLKKEKPEIISVCVPTTLHKEICTQTLEKGIATLVEKPIADTLESAEKLVETANKNHTHLAVGHIERFNPMIKKLKHTLNETIFSISTWRVGPQPPRIQDVGVILDLCTHDIDLIEHVSDSKIERVFCSTNSHNGNSVEDSALINLELENKVTASITANWLTPYKQREIEVITHKRVLRGKFIEQELREFVRSGQGEYSSNNLAVEHREPLHAELNSFVECVKNNKEPEVTGEDGARALKIALACIESGAERKIIEIK